jgi:hypothetical protein
VDATIALMVAKPVGEHGSGAIVQQADRSMPLEINQQRAVAAKPGWDKSTVTLRCAVVSQTFMLLSADRA